jgi:hypothetical protein
MVLEILALALPTKDFFFYICKTVAYETKD